ncbi:universal stress protein a-like protein [Plakobranchus ocellatus]|uniref:Universal stress protein a-like protein n=1 Tax=Plakobranchus ocellatus TaxID=259542 RepID=A0AAV4C7Z5_9GAST|nr:universal stress protein a-like protein [Plakobranchus ocellatus]
MANLHSPDNDVIVAHSSSHNASFPPVHTLMSSVRDSVAMSRAEQEEEEEVNRIVSQIKGKLTQAGVRGKLLRLTGDPGPAIIHASVDNNVTCIVTGSRGMGTVKRALVGSVSDYILHHAHCPVMVCRHKDINPKDKDRSSSYS